MFSAISQYLEDKNVKLWDKIKSSNETRSRGWTGKCKFTISENEQPRPSNVTRQIWASKAKSIWKMSELMIHENEEQRNMWKEYLQKQLQQVKNKSK